MTKRAVLIGAETYGLTGCHADVALIDEMLTGRDFETRPVVGGDSTRDGILGALRQLVADTEPGDAAVIYYSGHGGRMVRPDAEERKAAAQSTYFQFLVPHDMQDSTPGDFRGVLSEELTIVQRDLAEAFGDAPVNATTILDCCHSGYMARALTEAVARSIEPAEMEARKGSRMFTMAGILDHVNALGPDADTAIGATNQHVVRLTACQAEQSAFELPAHRGGTYGAFTDALVSVLDEFGDAAISWAIVGDLVRRRVRQVVPQQRPGIEGPASRMAFGADVLGADSLPIKVVGGTIVIEAAGLLGLTVGDLVRLEVPGTDRLDHEATVTDLRSGSAVLDATPADIGDDLASAIAVPVRVSIPPIGVSVADGDGRDELVDAIEGRGRLAVTDDAPVVQVLATEDGWQIADENGDPWRPPSAGSGSDVVAPLADEIEAIAVGHRLLDLASGAGATELPPETDVEFGKVVDGAPAELSIQGERIEVGTPVTLRLRNTANSERFVWVFDVGVSGRSALVTNAAPSGTRLGRSGDEDDTVDLWGRDGTPLSWPGDVPPDPNGRLESFVVITADDRNDLRGLASRERATRGTPSALDLVLDEVRSGTREVAAAGSTGGLRYRVDRVEFVVVPSDH